MNRLFVLLLLFVTLFSTVSAKSSDDSPSVDVLVDAVSSNSSLQDIKVDGESIADFAADVYEYYVELPQNTTLLPAVEYTLSDDSTQKGYLATAGVDGDAKITVIAEDGSTAIYTIHFSTYKSSNAALSNIYVDGVSLALDEFDDDNTITVDVISGASLSVTYERGDEWQSVAVADAGYNGCEILVVAQDGTTNKYYINYNVLPNAITELADIQIYDGSSFVSVAGFSADVELYSYELAWKTATVPAINPVLYNDGQIALVEYGAVNDTTFITVTAEDGETTQVYKVLFPVEKSTVSTLSQIYVDGVASLDFEPTQLDYYIDVPYGTTQLPNITWDLGEEIDGTVAKREVVAYNAGNIFTPSTVTVLAEDGVTSTIYTINYNVAYPANDATISSIYVDGVALSGFDKNILNYSVDLPYGTTDFPAITYSKSSATQSVLVKKVGGVNGQAEIIVLSNNSEGDEATYVVDFTVDQTPTTALTSVAVGGVDLARFDPTQSAYILPVTSQPTITYTYDNAALGATVLTSNTNMYQVKVYNLANTADYVTYSFYYHYTSDVIPNADFEDWTTAKYNSGAKPTSWAVPADGDDEYICKGLFITYGTYTTGGEVTKSAKDGYAVKLSTLYDWNSIAGSVPGMMTLGTLSLSLHSSNGSTSSCSGSIDFRNTPDNVYVDYKSAASTRMDNWRLLVTMGDGSTSVTTTYEGDFDDTSNWRSLTQPISYGSLSEIKKMNIVINSAETENAGSMASTAGYAQTSTLYVDNLAFQYSNLLSAITIDGQAISGFSSSTYSYTVARDADAQGAPTVVVTGAVDDQEHQISISDEDANRSRVVKILSIAEDGSEVTYTVNLTRAQSSNVALNAVTVNDIPLSGLGSTMSEYDFTVEALNRFVPNVAVEAASEYQTISYTTARDKVSINVTAENGTTATYVINLVEDAVGEARLTSITVSDSELVFDAATNDYAVTLEYDAVLPAIEFEKFTDTQSVLLTVADTTTLLVTAQDGVTTNEYRILFSYVPFPASGVLTDIKLNDISLSDFASDNYNYQAMADDDNLWQFTAGSITDRVSQRFTYSSLELIVEGDDVSTSTYTIALTHTYTPSSDASLTTLQLNGEELSEFSSTLYNYEYTIERGDYPSLLARSVEKATLSVDYTTADSGAKEFVYTSTSEDANNTASTTVAFTTALNTEVALSDVLINGVSLQTVTDTYSASSDFDAEVLEYDIELFSETPKMSQPSMPSISYVDGAYGQSVLVEKGDVNSTTNITVTSESGATRVYELNFTTQKSSNTSLNDIALDLVSIENFDAATYNYTVDILASDELPAVTYQMADNFQTVEETVVADTIIVTVTAEDGTQVAYTISFNRTYYSDASLLMIYKDDVAIDDFAVNVLEYYIDLPVGTEDFPEISVMAGNEGQTISVTNADVDSTTTITVVAEDGVSTRNYVIYFTVLKSENDTLSMIAIDDVDLEDFSPSIFDYAVELPIGTTDVPEVSVEAGDEWQTITITQADNVNGKAVIDVAAENGDEQSYTIDFTVEKSHDATLQSIFVGGESLAGFDSETYNYVVQVPYGSVDVPVVSYAASQPAIQTVTLVSAATLSDTTSITVVAEDGTTTITYKVAFEILKSENAQLKDISVGGSSLDDFDADVLEYYVNLPIGTEVVPEITAVAGDDVQTITIVGGGVNGTTTITVEAEDGVTTNVYKIHFTRLLLEDNTLQMITLDGDDLVLVAENYSSSSAFDSDVRQYTITLPVGSQMPYPTVGWVASHSLQTITSTTDETTGSVTITVTPEDTDFIDTYQVDFVVEKSHDATLQSIFVDGETLVEFDSNIHNYVVQVPYGSVDVPVVTYTASQPDIQTVTLVSASTLSDTTSITVLAEDGTTTITYKVAFEILKSENAQLKDISVGGSSLDDFDADVLEYYVNLPIGTEVVPEITAVAGDDVQTITIVGGGVNGTTTITVEAEDGVTTNVYKIHFTRLLLEDNTLQMITLDGDDLVLVAENYSSSSAFDSDVRQYTITLPVGSQMPYPTVGWVASHSLQTITSTTDETTGSVTITVTPEDTDFIDTYQVDFVVEKSHDATLQSIFVDGETLVEFDSNIHNYVVQVPYGSVDVPVVTYTASQPDIQTVTLVSASTLSDTTSITVLAEDGTTSITYKVAFEIEKSDNSYLSSLLVNGLEIQDFSPTLFNYTYYLSSGESIPEFEGVKSEESQIIEYVVSPIDQYSHIYVTAEDGSISDYTILFKYSTVVTDVDAVYSADAVTWSDLGNGNYLASSAIDDVKVMIYTSQGLLLRTESLSRNEDIELAFNRKNAFYVYVFVYKNKAILSGKIIY